MRERERENIRSSILGLAPVLSRRQNLLLLAATSAVSQRIVEIVRHPLAVSSRPSVSSSSADQLIAGDVGRLVRVPRKRLGRGVRRRNAHAREWGWEGAIVVVVESDMLDLYKYNNVNGFLVFLRNNEGGVQGRRTDGCDTLPKSSG